MLRNSSVTCVAETAQSPASPTRPHRIQVRPCPDQVSPADLPVSISLVQQASKAVGVSLSTASRTGRRPSFCLAMQRTQATCYRAPSRCPTATTSSQRAPGALACSLSPVPTARGKEQDETLQTDTAQCLALLSAVKSDADRVGGSFVDYPASDLRSALEPRRRSPAPSPPTVVSSMREPDEPREAASRSLTFAKKMCIVSWDTRQECRPAKSRVPARGTLSTPDTQSYLHEPRMFKIPV
jgi:hypothetical protein